MLNTFVVWFLNLVSPSFLYEPTSFETEGNLEDGTFGVGIGDRGDAFGGDTIQGMIDEVRIYGRGLSEAKVKQNFAAKGLAVEPDLKLSLTWGQMKGGSPVHRSGPGACSF